MLRRVEIGFVWKTTSAPYGQWDVWPYYVPRELSDDDAIAYVADLINSTDFSEEHILWWVYSMEDLESR